MLTTDFYFAPFLPLKPVLVFRGCDQRCVVGKNLPYLWPANAAYHLIAQDMREDCGSNEDLLFQFDQADGHTLLNGIDLQGWSQGPNGHIAMEGWSNAGILSYLAAVNAGPSLRGIQPHFATGDLLNYGLFNGGVLHREVADFLGYPEGTPWEDYVGMPIWNNYLITDSQAASTNVAGLHVGGWFDVFGQGILDSFSRLQTAGNPQRARNKQKVVIGPWGHGEGVVGQIPFPSPTPSNPFLLDYDAAWKQSVFQDNSTAWNALPAVKVYLMNATPGTEWRNYNTWPPPGFQFPFYFTKDNKLSGNHQSSPAALTFMSDPLHPCPTLGGTNNLASCVTASPVPCGPWNQRGPPLNIEARSDVVLFTSDAFATEGAIVGRMHADVWIQTNLLDVDVFVRMTDVHPDGRSMLMAQGIQRARYRNGACPLPLNLTQPTKVRVDMSSTALVIKAGHKVRVIVSASAGPNQAGTSPFIGGYSVNPQNGNEYLGTPPIGTAGSINVLTGGANESVLWLSVPGGTTPQPDERPNTTPCPN